MSLRPSARTEVRRNRYKVAVDAEEGRRRREDNMVEIRKSRREESLLKKRREGLQQLSSGAAQNQLQQPLLGSSFQSSATGLEKKVLSLSLSLALRRFVLFGFSFDRRFGIWYKYWNEREVRDHYDYYYYYYYFALI